MSYAPGEWTNAHASAHPPTVTGARLVGAGFVAFAYFILIGLVPYYAELFAARLGLGAPVDPSVLLFFGALLAVLTGVAFALKPTNAWGPACITVALVGLGYLAYLLQHPAFVVTFSHFGVAITYRDLLELLLIPPFISLVAGIVTTVEDVRNPGERARIMFA
jgi:hypothetical protein